MVNVMFNELWELALRESEKLDDRPSEVFSPLGLYLVEPVFESWGYPQTPTNAVTFGSTGVDGEHFSFLERDGKVLNPSPVVMTVPMAPEGFENTIVGKDLVDFLSLGYEVCFSALPSLANPGSARLELIADLVKRVPCWEGEDPEDDWTVAQRYLSRVLEAEFELQSWNNVEVKLADLANKYSHLIEVQDLNV